MNKYLGSGIAALVALQHFVMPLVLIAITTSIAHSEEPWIKVSANRRYLVHQDGSPFIYLGDTAWELFHRLDREQADRYLEDRAAKGFTVIQAVLLAEFNDKNSPNAYGHQPLVNEDPTKPDTKPGPNNDYWDHVDSIVNKAELLGLTIGMLPTWGDKWNKKWGLGPEIFDAKNARVYGEWIGRRYRDKPIIWILGGDRPIETDRHRNIIHSMAAGLAKGDGGRHLMTFHPSGRRGSSEWFHNENWLDFNMRQTGHNNQFQANTILADYRRSPSKPVMDGEPIYEDIPIKLFKANEHGHSISADVRRLLYWNLFSGSFGHTYGHNSVWQMWDSSQKPHVNPLMPWDEAINQPGAKQMKYGMRLLQSRPFLSRIPDNSIISPHQRVPTLFPGAGLMRLVATRDEEHTYAMVYTPVGRPFHVHMNVIAGPLVSAWWYNPRNGKAEKIGDFPNQGDHKFIPPTVGEYLDWILVLDDTSCEYGTPGEMIFNKKSDE